MFATDKTPDEIQYETGFIRLPSQFFIDLPNLLNSSLAAGSDLLNFQKYVEEINKSWQIIALLSRNNKNRGAEFSQIRKPNIF